MADKQNKIHFEGSLDSDGGTKKLNMADTHSVADYVTLKEWGSLRDDVFGLKKDYATLQSSVSEMAVGVRALAAKFDESRKPNWVVVISLLGLVFGILPVMAGGSLWIISGQISQAVSPISSRISQLETSGTDQAGKLQDLTRQSNEYARELSNVVQQVTANTGDIHRNIEGVNHLAESAAASSVADGISKSDRIQLNDRLRKVEDDYTSAVSERKGQIAEINARLLEVEQQFHAVNNVSNLRWADQLRANAMTYEKLHPGERYPLETFYPSNPTKDAPVSMGR